MISIVMRARSLSLNPPSSSSSPSVHPKSLSPHASSSSPSLCSPVALEMLQLLNEGKCEIVIQLAKVNAYANGDCAGLLALCYSSGYGTNISHKERERWSQVAIEAGTTLGCAIGYYILKKYDLSLPFLQVLVKENMSVAQYMLGLQLHLGLGIAKDVREGLLLYQKAAGQGNPSAMYALAFCYKNGDGVEMDFKKAFSLYQECADKGLCRAFYNLGLCYEVGVGVPKDKKKALSYFQQGAAKGDEEASQKLGVAYLEGKFGLKKDKREAMKHLELAAALGSERAERKLRELKK